MRHAFRSLTVSTFVVGTMAAGVTARAADLPKPIVTAARCASKASTTPPGRVVRVVGAQDTTDRLLFGRNDLLIINAGTQGGLQPGQQFFIRRPAIFGDRNSLGPRAIGTAGWLRIVSTNDTTAIGVVEFACDAIVPGDYLEAYVEPILPEGIDRVNTQGEPDFTKPSRILFGENERRTAGTGDFMVIDGGSNHGITPGARFAIYRDLHVNDLPLAPLGEAVVVSADPDTAVVRITLARNYVGSGDLLVPRK